MQIVSHDHEHHFVVTQSALFSAYHCTQKWWGGQKRNGIETDQSSFTSRQEGWPCSLRGACWGTAFWRDWRPRWAISRAELGSMVFWRGSFLRMEQFSSEGRGRDWGNEVSAPQVVDYSARIEWDG